MRIGQSSNEIEGNILEREGWNFEGLEKSCLGSLVMFDLLTWVACPYVFNYVTSHAWPVEMFPSHVGTS